MHIIKKNCFCKISYTYMELKYQLDSSPFYADNIEIYCNQGQRYWFAFILTSKTSETEKFPVLSSFTLKNI